MQIGEALRRLRQGLRATSDSPASDARLLLADTLGTTTTWVLAHDGEAFPPEAEAALGDRLLRLGAGEPLPYVLGWWEFYGRRFVVDANVLIPRPETELIVDRALTELNRRPGESHVVDVGTGSGCLAVTLACERPNAIVTATDVSRGALAVARANAAVYQVRDRVRFVRTSLLEGLAGGWDIVCANLPYVPTGRLASIPVARHEPIVALDGGRRGTEINARLIACLPRTLAPGGLALLEIDTDQAEELALLVDRTGGGLSAEVLPDLKGRARILALRRGGDGR